MRKFHDMHGREWGLSVSIGAVKRVREQLDIDLLKVGTGQLIDQLVDDLELLCNVLYVLVKPQADERNVTDVQFGESLGGDSLEDAQRAFLEALTDFFPPQKRQVLTKALAKLKEVESRVVAKATALMDSPALEAKIAKELETLGSEFGSSLASPESPAPSSTT